MANTQSLTLPLILLAVLLAASPSLAWGPYGSDDSGGGPGPWGYGNPWDDGSSSGSSTDSSSDSGSGSTITGSEYASLPIFQKMNRVAIAHAVLASLAWVIFIPIAAILLRLNINSPIIIKIHAAIQIFSYIIFIAATGMGIWLTKEAAAYSAVWRDPHVIIGLIIFTLVFFQPIFGIVHHKIYKQRAADAAAGINGPKPGRTTFSRLHVWLGRILITTAIINGGLGLRLAGQSQTQTETTTRNAKIAYGAFATSMWLLYVVITALWEYRKSVRERQERLSGQYIMSKRGGYASRSEETLPPPY